MGGKLPMRILVLGAEGMAGHMISSYLKAVGYDVTDFTRRELDIEKSLHFPMDYDYVINCIGVLLPDSEKDMQRTVFVNSYLPQYLSSYYTNGPIIHISTDCVFDGKRGHYSEYEIPNERHIYGLSKGLGELNNTKDITLRVSIIGPEIKSPERRSGLLNWILTEPSPVLMGYTKAWWNGITTLELAKVIEQYLNDPVHGIFHPVNESVNKFELLSLINEVYGLGKTINPIEGPKEVNKVLECTRPYFSVAPLRKQLEELKAWSSGT